MIVWTLLNYARVFRSFLGAPLSARDAAAIGNLAGRAAYAVVSPLGPAAAVLIVVWLANHAS